MRLVTKLLLSFLVVALLVLITGSLSYYLSNEIKADLINESRETAAELQNLTEMTVSLQNSMLYIRNYLNEAEKIRSGDESLTTSSQVRQAEATVTQNLENFSELLTTLKQDLRTDTFSTEPMRQSNDEIYILLDSLQVAFQPYKNLIAELFELEKEDRYGEEIYNLTIEPYFRNTLIPLLTQIRDNSNRFVELQMDNLQARAENTVSRIILITLSSFVLALLLGYVVYQSIAQPVKKLTSVAREIGDGKLEKRIKLKSNDELGKLAESINQMAESLSNSMVSKSYVNNIIQSMGDMLLVVDPDGNILMSNRAVYDKLGYSKSDLKSLNIKSLLKEEEQQKILDHSRHETGNEADETELITKTGNYLPVVFSYSNIQDDLNEERNLVFVASDISSQKEAEKKISSSLREKNILLAEIHHRVKNNLAVISGLLQMQMWNMEDETGKDALYQSQMRIQSIALVHEKLYQNETFADIGISDFVEDLVDAVSKSFDMPDKEILLKYDLDNIRMNMTQAIPFALLLNECVINSYKHAFKETDEGLINIKLRRNGEEVNVDVLDNGSGLPDEVEFETQSTLGMTLMRTLVSQLKGKARFKNKTGESGTHFKLSFKLERSQQ